LVCDIKIRWNDDEMPPEMPEEKRQGQESELKRESGKKENDQPWSLLLGLEHIPLNDTELCRALSMLQMLPVSVAEAVIFEYNHVVEVEASIGDHSACFFGCAKRLLSLYESSRRSGEPIDGGITETVNKRLED
jgi:hypothetical protein